MASKARPPLKTHSLFPNSPSNRLLRMEYKCGCLHFIFVPSLTPAQTYAMPPVITLEICPSSALSSHIDYQGDIEYRKGLSNPKGGREAHAGATSRFRMDPYSMDHHRAVPNEIQVYVCWSVNWDGPIPPYPGLPPGNRDDLHFPSAFILDGSHGKWDCRVPQCWDNSRPWAPLIPSRNCSRYQNHPGLQSLVDVAIEACNDGVLSKHDHPVNTPGLFVLPSLLFTINLFNSIRDAEITLFKEARGRPFVMWLRSYMYPVPDGKPDEEWLKEREFRHIEEVFGRLGIAQRYVCELIALAEWCRSCWNLMIGQYPAGPFSGQVTMRKDCVGGWVTGAPLPIIWHYQKIGVPLFFIEHCKEDQLPKGLRKELLPDLNGIVLAQSPEYQKPPAVLFDVFSTILGLIPQPLCTTRGRSQDARWAPHNPPESWVNPLSTTVPIRWFPTIHPTTSQFRGLSERIQMLASYNHLRCSHKWYSLMQDVRRAREQTIQWKDERRFITHPRHAFQPSAALKPVPLPDEDDITHFWVERVDGQGFAEVDAVYINEFKTRGFIGWRHKLCARLVFFYMPGSLDSATEAEAAKILKPLEYTEEPRSMDIGIDLDHIPCDPPMMKSQMSGSHDMEQLERGRILISKRMMDYIDAGGLEPGSNSQRDQGDPTECEEGEIGGFDHCPSFRSNAPSSGPVRTIKSSAEVVQKTGFTGTRQRAKRKPWALRDAPSDRRHRLWTQWIKLADYFNSHQDILNDLEPLPVIVPGKHSTLSKPGWEGMQKVAEALCSWIHQNRYTARWLASQHSGDKDRKGLWEATLRRMEYTRVWNTPQMDIPREDEPAARREWLQAKARWVPENR